MASGRITHFIWTDIAPEEEDAFNDWYENEHMPDRVLRVPGFTRGRRFGAVSGGPKYLAYYEMANSDVFWTKEYVAMRSEPDPKSRHFVARFKNALRSTATIAFERDQGEGSILGIAGMTARDNADAQLLDASQIEAAFVPGLTRIRLSKTSDELVQGNFKKMDEHARGSLRPRDRVPSWVVTVEGNDRSAVATTLCSLQAAFDPQASTDASAIMDLLSTCSPRQPA